MKPLIYILGIMAMAFILSDWATIVGGSKYHAKVQVPDEANAKISYNGV